MKKLTAILGTAALLYLGQAHSLQNYNSGSALAVEKTPTKKYPHKDGIHYAANATGRKDCNICDFNIKLFEFFYLAEEVKTIATNQKIDEAAYKRAKNFQDRTRELILEISKFDDKRFYENFIERSSFAINSYANMIITTYNSGHIRNFTRVDSETINDLRMRINDLNKTNAISYQTLMSYPRDEVFIPLEDKINYFYKEARPFLIKKFESNLSEWQRIREADERYKAKLREIEETKDWEDVEK